MCLSSAIQVMVGQSIVRLTAGLSEVLVGVLKVYTVHDFPELSEMLID